MSRTHIYLQKGIGQIFWERPWEIFASLPPQATSSSSSSSRDLQKGQPQGQRETSWTLIPHSHKLLEKRNKPKREDAASSVDDFVWWNRRPKRSSLKFGMEWSRQHRRQWKAKKAEEIPVYVRFVCAAEVKRPWLHFSQACYQNVGSNCTSSSWSRSAVRIDSLFYKISRKLPRSWQGVQISTPWNYQIIEGSFHFLLATQTSSEK